MDKKISDSVLKLGIRSLRGKEPLTPDISVVFARKEGVLGV